MRIDWRQSHSQLYRRKTMKMMIGKWHYVIVVKKLFFQQFHHHNIIQTPTNTRLFRPLSCHFPFTGWGRKEANCTAEKRISNEMHTVVHSGEKETFFTRMRHRRKKRWNFLATLFPTNFHSTGNN